MKRSAIRERQIGRMGAKDAFLSMWGNPGFHFISSGLHLLHLLNGQYRLATEQDMPQTIGHLSAFMGNTGILLRAYVYARQLGAEGMKRVADFATLNANYLMVELSKAGFDIAFPQRRASHEFIVTLKGLKEQTGVSAMNHQLSQQIGRDYKNVHTDVKALEELGLLQREKGGLVAPFDEIDIKVDLRKAA